MTEVLISQLGKISSPRVISRQSVMQYKGSKRPLQEIARELNVDAVLEGTVERSGDQVRVIVHLDQVSPEGQLWSNQYNRDIRDMLGLQDEIARTVTDEIRVKLKPQEYARLAGSAPVNPDVQDLYFRALYFRNKGAVTTHYDEQELLAAISYFRQAIEKDSKYGQVFGTDQLLKALKIARPLASANSRVVSHQVTFLAPRVDAPVTLVRVLG